MDHSVAIACLKDDLDLARQDCDYLSRVISQMMLRNASGSHRIRQDSLMRLNRKLTERQEKVLALRSTIKFLEQHNKEGK